MKSIHDKLNTSIGTKTLTITTAFGICASMFAFFGSDVLQPIAFINQGLFEALNEAWTGFPAFLNTGVGKIVCALLLAAISGAWILRQFYRTRIILIAHSTMNEELRLDASFMQKYWRKKHDLTLRLLSDNDVVQALSKQDKQAESVINSIMEDKRPVFYFGIAHTPLIFRLGYQLSGKRIKFLHQYRVGVTEHCFSELRKFDEDRMPLNCVDKFEVQGATELLFGIGATYQVKCADLDAIDPRHTMYRYIYSIEEDMRGVDFFSSENKINALATSIVKYLEDFCKEFRFEKVHIVISASVAFTFLLAQRMNTRQLPEIVVYHYYNGSYPWGVVIKENDANKAVIYPHLVK